MREEEGHKPDLWRKPVERNKKKYTFFYIMCIAYDKLLKPRQSF